MNLWLEGRVALITGGASGIGAGIAKTLAHEGAIVYVGDVNEAGASATASRLSASGYVARALPLDVSREETVGRAVRSIVGSENRLDILVNSAGVLRSAPLEFSGLDDWNALSKVNVGGIYACSKVALETIMVSRGYGKILNLASISASKGGGLIGNTLYGASKAAVIALTQGFAREYGPFGINVNAMAPGLTQTPMIAALDDSARDKIVSTVPVRRLAEPDDIANLAAFLVSDMAAYINGAAVVIDGGVLTL